jgi:type IX secretion system PorP/SprF family membrane protein
MKSTVESKSCSTTLKELNLRWLYLIDIQLFQSCEIAHSDSIDFIYGYSYSIPLELLCAKFCIMSNYDITKNQIFKKMKKLFYTLFLLPAILRGQMSPLFSIYREQTATINPAMPSQNYLVNNMNNSIGATYRYQWLGVEGAPVTQVLSYECLPINKNILVGGHIANDQTGDIGLMSVNGQFAYKMALSKTDSRFLSIGFSTGVQSYRANLAAVAALENSAVDNTKSTLVDLSMGIYYHQDKSFYAGISLPQILGNTIYLNTTDKSLHPALQKSRQVFVVAGKYFNAPFFGNDVAYLEPNFWLRYLPDTHEVSLDLNVRAKISNSFWVGTGYNLSASTFNFETGSILGKTIGLDNSLLKIGMGFGIPMGGTFAGLGPIGEVHVSYSWETKTKDSK